MERKSFFGMGVATLVAIALAILGGVLLYQTGWSRGYANGILMASVEDGVLPQAALIQSNLASSGSPLVAWWSSYWSCWACCSSPSSYGRSECTPGTARADRAARNLPEAPGGGAIRPADNDATDCVKAMWREAYHDRGGSL